MWTETEKQAVLASLTSYWPRLSPEEATNIAKALGNLPHLQAMKAIELCFTGQTVSRKPTPREILGHLGSEQGARDASMTSRMRMYREIDALDKQVVDQPKILLRGHTWELAPAGISRKIDPASDWRNSNTKAIPMGDLSEEEVRMVLTAYRQAPKVALHVGEPPP